MEQKVKKIILNGILKIPNLSTQKYKCRNFPDMFGRSSFLEKSNICTFGLTIWVSLGFRENENFLQNLVLSPCSANTSDFDNLNLPHLSLDYEKVFTCPAGQYYLCKWHCTQFQGIFCAVFRCNSIFRTRATSLSHSLTHRNQISGISQNSGLSWAKLD